MIIKCCEVDIYAYYHERVMVINLVFYSMLYTSELKKHFLLNLPDDIVHPGLQIFIALCKWVIQFSSML